MAPEKKKDTTGRERVSGGPIRRNKRNHGEGMAADEDTELINEDDAVAEKSSEETTDGAADGGPIRRNKRTHGEVAHDKEMEAE